MYTVTKFNVIDGNVRCFDNSPESIALSFECLCLSSFDSLMDFFDGQLSFYRRSFPSCFLTLNTKCFRPFSTITLSDTHFVMYLIHCDY